MKISHALMWLNAESIILAIRNLDSERD